MATCIGILIAAGVMISSRGPVIYSQIRLGKGGKPFRFYKFRSMYSGSEPDGPVLASGDLHDPRITPFGSFIRRTKLDELPQLFNVIRGDMSLVGPRPERPHFVKQILRESNDYERNFNIKPGITSMGQVEFGYGHNIPDLIERMKIDLEYLDQISLKTDLKILFKTFKILIFLSPKPKKSVYFHSH